MQVRLPPRARRAASCALLFAGVVLPCAPVRAASGTPALGSIHGTVMGSDGAPVGAARVTFDGEGRVTSVRSTQRGDFDVEGMEPGVYSVSVSATGYADFSGRTIDVRAGANAPLSFSLSHSTTSLVTVGSVETNGGDALSTTSAAIGRIDPQRYAVEGYTQLSDVLQNDVAATLVHPLGGSATSLPASIALRGPDPTETLVALDGHQINNGNTGDFDLTLLDPADYGNVELIKGISPSALVGPNTIDGAINIRTIEPTVTPQSQARFSAGQYGSYFETLQTTGTYGRLGYAISGHQTWMAGQVNQNVIDQAGGDVQRVGSAVEGSTLLGTLRYALGNSGAFAAFTVHDQSMYRDLSAGLSSLPPPGGGSSSDSSLRRALSGSSTPAASPDAPYQVLSSPSFAGTDERGHNSSYGLDIGVPLGSPDSSGVTRTTALLRGFTSLVSQSVFGPGADTSPYLFNDRDLVGEISLAVTYDLARSSLTASYDIRNEQLTTDYVAGGENTESVRRFPEMRAAAARYAPLEASGSTASGSGVSSIPLTQTERSALLRYSIDPTAKLHFTLAAYYSAYSTFGSNFDPRFGFAWTPTGATAVRFSVGTTFQAPQLTELYVPPVLPPPVGGIISIGNPNLKADYATEYSLGFEHLFETGVHRTSASLDFYRVNLRQPSSTYIPSEDCAGAGCLSFPVNAGDAVYAGFELSASRRLAPNVTVQAAYAVHSAYLTSVPPYIQDGSLVVGEQTLGLPLHKATLGVASTPPHGFTLSGALIYEGQYNELNQPPYATLAASLGYRWRVCELTLSGTNLTNVYAQQFTRQDAGVPYDGTTGPIATPSYALPSTALTLSLSYHL